MLETIIAGVILFCAFVGMCWWACGVVEGDKTEINITVNIYDDQTREKEVKDK